MADGLARETEVTLYPLFGVQTASGSVLVRLETCNFCWGNLTFIEWAALGLSASISSDQMYG
jgi:hypothetical protein